MKNEMTFAKKGNNAWLYQRQYYRNFVWKLQDDEKYAPDFFDKRLSWLKAVELVDIGYQKSKHFFTLKTVYPGLVTGVGVAHESKSLGEMKLGFEFDYSTGMPVIRGHSVKGALRAAFPQMHRRKVKHQSDKAYQIYCLIKGLEPNEDGLAKFLSDPLLIAEISVLEQEIFEGRRKDRSLLSCYAQDVFYDATITRASTYGPTQNQYLGKDFITPHPDPLKNPTPIPFLKVLPGVEFTFRFDLHDGEYLEAKEKKALFEKILRYNGIGAKTSVGYGQFE